MKRRGLEVDVCPLFGYKNGGRHLSQCLVSYYDIDFFLSWFELRYLRGFSEKTYLSRNTGLNKCDRAICFGLGDVLCFATLHALSIPQWKRLLVDLQRRSGASDMDTCIITEAMACLKQKEFWFSMLMQRA